MATAMRTASIGFASRLTTTRSSVAAHTHLTLRQRRPTASFRTFSATTRRFAQYERFGYDHSSARPDGFGSGGGGGGKRPSGSQHPIILALRRRLGDRGLVLWGVGLTGCGIYYVFHLERVPETGRLRFIDVSPEKEEAMGLRTQQETLAQFQGQLLPASNPTSRRVREIARRIVEGNGLGHMKDDHSWTNLPDIKLSQIWGGGEQPEEPMMGDGYDPRRSLGSSTNKRDVEWEVYVIKDDSVKNAFVLPGGKIFVFTGILPVSKNDDGLATVMGHEIAHQVARHSAERMSSMKVFFVLAYLMEALGIDIGLGRILLTFMLQLPNSRQSESEADRIGLRLMAKACYDPRESTKMWERMSESEKGSGSGLANMDFMSTHPANSKRIKQLSGWMHEALDVRAATHCGDSSSQMRAFRDKAPMMGDAGRVWG